MLRKICNFLIGIMIVVLVITALLLFGPRALGYQGFAVLSGSMEPEISVGSVVFSKEADPNTLKEGDVITYRIGGDTLVTHRIVEIDAQNQQVTTKGDANDTQDGSPVPFEQIVGKMGLHIPYLGYISIYMKTPVGIGVICGILVALILLNFLPEIFAKDAQEETQSKKKNKVKRESHLK